VAVARGEAAAIISDGVRTVEQLVADQINSDPRRGEAETFPLTPIEFKPEVVLQLERQGFNRQSIPPSGARVVLQRHDNLSTDVTEKIHPSTAAHAVLAVQIVGLDVAGIDCVVEDISKPLESQGGVFVEVNAGPGLLMHLRPSIGTPQPVGEAIVESLYPAGQNGRIPIVCVTGTNGKTIVSRLVAHILRAWGRVVGLTTTDGIFVEGRTIESGDCSGPRSARKVLLNPHVEAGVFEAGRGGILREGLGFDRCDVAVVTNIAAADHLGLAYIDTVDQMYTVKRSPVDVVLPTGTAILKADDPLVAEMAPLSAGSVIFFAHDGEHPVMLNHRAQGKRAVFVRDGKLVFSEGMAETGLVPIDRVPLTHGGRVGFQVENVLAATAAAWSLGVDFETIRSAVKNFQPDMAHCPGRFNLLAYHGASVVIDDAHNTSALAALISALENFPHERRTIVYSAGDGRRDADIIRQGELLAGAFDRVILYDDFSASDRAAGETAALFRQGLAAGSAEVLEVPEHRQAIETALSNVAAGELIVIQPDDEDIQPTLDIIRALAVREASEESGCYQGIEGN